MFLDYIQKSLVFSLALIIAAATFLTPTSASAKSYEPASELVPFSGNRVVNQSQNTTAVVRHNENAASELVPFSAQSSAGINRSQQPFIPVMSGVNRVEALKIIFNGLDLDVDQNRYIEYLGFSDLDRLSWYMPYVESALNLNIVRGYSDKTFRPGKLVTRAEALKMLLETARVQDGFALKTKTYGLPYRDVPATDDNRWSISYIWAAQELELTADEIYFNPHLPITKAELEKMVERYKESRT